VKISDVNRDLKSQDGLTPQEVIGNLTYLLSQGWVAEVKVEKEYQAPGGTVIPSVTSNERHFSRGIEDC